jgi:hypothetical protein
MHSGLATLYDLVGMIAGAKHRNAYHVAFLLKKGSAWHVEWSSAHLKHDPQWDGKPQARVIALTAINQLAIPVIKVEIARQLRL